MLPKANRLTKETDFKKIAKGAKPIHSKFFLLKKLSTPEKLVKFGIVISSKISKKAVVRNKIRRQIREVLKENLADIKTGQKVMIVVKDTALNKDFKEIKQDLENLLIKTKLL